MSAEFVPLTLERYAEVSGAPPERSLRGFAVEEDGRAVLVVVMYADEDRHVIASEAKPEFRARLSTLAARRIVLMAARKAQEMIATVRGPVVAGAAEEFPHTERFLERMGFVRQLAGEYRYDAQARFRHKVWRAEQAMRSAPEVPIPVQHFFSDGVYARHGRIPAGTMLTGHIHKKWNLNILSEGEMSVLTPEGMRRVKGPFVIVSPPGLKRIAYCHTDCVWTTIHGTHETDLAKIEAEFIAKTEQEWLEYARLGGAEERPRLKGVG